MFKGFSVFSGFRIFVVLMVLCFVGFEALGLQGL